MRVLCMVEDFTLKIIMTKLVRKDIVNIMIITIYIC